MTGDPMTQTDQSERVEAGRFASWSTADLAAQCRAQAREQLDPEFSAFCLAVADRLASLSPADPQIRRDALEDGWVLVPREVSHARADLIGAPKELIDRIIGLLAAPDPAIRSLASGDRP